MDKLTNCEKASKCKVLGINEWTFELHKDTDEVLLKSYNNPDLSSLDIIEIPDFVTYIDEDAKFNNDIFNIVLLKYTMTQYDYKVEPEYLTELFKFISKRLNETIKKHGEYGIEQIKDYKNKNSDFHVELINIFRMAGHYDKLFGFIETKEYG